MEVPVLFRVKHFEQCRRGVALEVLSHFIDLIEHDDRIIAAALGKSSDNSARHSSNIGATMTSNLGLIMQTT